MLNTRINLSFSSLGLALVLCCICYLTFHKSTASNKKMRIPTNKLMAMIHPTTYPRGSRLCKASKTTYIAIRKKNFLELEVVLFSLVLILLNILYGGLTDHISSVKQIENAALI